MIPRRVLLLAGALPLALARADGQTIGGQVVGLKTQKPVTSVSVALVDDSARVVATVAADSATGNFYVDAPRAGRYRVVLFAPGSSFVSPPLQVDSGQVVERIFSVPEAEPSARDVWFASDVETPAMPLPRNPAPRYPDAELAANMRGVVVAMVVVDEEGHPDPATFQVVNDALGDFAAAVRDVVARWRYTPARKDGHAVRQVVQVGVDFGFLGDPPRLAREPGNVVIRATGITRREP